MAQRLTPGAKAPFFCWWFRDPKAEALGYLEAEATANANAKCGGSLHCASHDETVSSFGRDDAVFFFVGKRNGYNGRGCDGLEILGAGLFVIKTLTAANKRLFFIFTQTSTARSHRLQRLNCTEFLAVASYSHSSGVRFVVHDFHSAINFQGNRRAINDLRDRRTADQYS